MIVAILSLVSFAVSLLTLVVVMRIAHLAHRRALATALALKRAEALREEMVLIQVDNDQLRREGVWFDDTTGVWVGRYVLTTSAPNPPAVYAALAQQLPTFALRLANDSWPHATPKH